MKRVLRPALCLTALIVGVSGAFCKRSPERNALSGGGERPAPRAITPNERFLDAVRRDDRLAAAEQLQRGADPQTVDPLGANAAALAASFSADPDFFVYLLKQGANAHVPDHEGRTALSWAAEKDHALIVRTLLSRGANPDEADKSGRTPLHHAASAQARRSAALLLEGGANPNRQDRLGDTALMLAAGREDEALVRLLLTHGANRALRDREGRTAHERCRHDRSLQELLR